MLGLDVHADKEVSPWPRRCPRCNAPREFNSQELQYVCNGYWRFRYDYTIPPYVQHTWVSGACQSGRIVSALGTHTETT